MVFKPFYIKFKLNIKMKDFTDKKRENGNVFDSQV